VLKDYAFGYYFAGTSTPSVRTRNVIIDRTEGRFAGWFEDGERRPAPLTPAGEERVLALAPLVPGTPLVEIRPKQLSMFSTLDARRASEASISVESPIAWRATASDPSLFAVAPVRRRGAGTVRLVPIGRSDPVDRITEVIIWSDESEPTELGRAAVRVRITAAFPQGRPFGSVDTPAALVLSPDPGERLTLEGWALDSFSLRRVYGEAVDASGRRMPLGEASRDGERPDVSKTFPAAHDLYRARWTLTLDPAAIGSLARPLNVEVFGENSDGVRNRIGTRTLR